MPRTTTSTQFCNNWRQSESGANTKKHQKIWTRKNASRFNKASRNKSSSFRVCKVGRFSAMKAAAATVSDAHLERSARHGATLKVFVEYGRRSRPLAQD